MFKITGAALNTFVLDFNSIQRNIFSARILVIVDDDEGLDVKVFRFHFNGLDIISVPVLGFAAYIDFSDPDGFIDFISATVTDEVADSIFYAVRSITKLLNDNCDLIKATGAESIDGQVPDDLWVQDIFKPQDNTFPPE
jgi:hypothetical protein